MAADPDIKQQFWLWFQDGRYIFIQGNEGLARGATLKHVLAG